MKLTELKRRVDLIRACTTDEDLKMQLLILASEDWTQGANVTTVCDIHAALTELPEDQQDAELMREMKSAVFENGEQTDTAEKLQKHVDWCVEIYAAATGKDWFERTPAQRAVAEVSGGEG